MKVISRSAGRSSTAAAAYRAAEKILDKRTGLTHDFKRKRGVVFSQIYYPGGQVASRSDFWNLVEAHHKRGDAVLAREIEVSLPFELSDLQRHFLTEKYALELADRYGVCVDFAIHNPSRGSDTRNHHAHILMSACLVNKTGVLGKKALRLDPIACKRAGLTCPADYERARWEQLVNSELEKYGFDQRVDHRSYQARGFGVVPTIHIGPSATQAERAGRKSRLGNENRRRKALNAQLRDERLKFAALEKELSDVELNEKRCRQRQIARRRQDNRFHKGIRSRNYLSPSP